MTSFIRRASMLLLFVAALYTTVSTISNLTFAEVIVWNEGKTTDDSQIKTVGLSNKQAGVLKLETKEATGEEVSDQTLEEIVSLEQHPRQTLLATGYTAGIESTGKTSEHPEYGITFSGVHVKRDLYSTIAADLDLFPIGTIMYIPDYGYGVVADKGSAITGNKIDLYYHTVEDVYAQWGKKEVEVYIVKLGDGVLTEEELLILNENETMQVFRDEILN